MQRVGCRGAFTPILQEIFQKLDLLEATETCERVCLPFVLILRLDQLLDDPHEYIWTIAYACVSVSIKSRSVLHSNIIVLLKFNEMKVEIARGRK